MTSYALSIVDVTKTGHGEGARGTGKKRGAEKERGERRRSAGSGEGARGAEKAVSYTHLTLPTSDLV